MAQSQGYKRFRLSVNTIHQGTSTPQAANNKIFPRASTPNRRSIEHLKQATVPVVPSPRSTVAVHHKIQKKRRHARSNHPYQIHIDHIILIQQQRKSCSHCRCKKANLPKS